MGATRIGSDHQIVKLLALLKLTQRGYGACRCLTLENLAIRVYTNADWERYGEKQDKEALKRRCKLTDGKPLVCRY
jgi:hypothetical protein